LLEFRISNPLRAIEALKGVSLTATRGEVVHADRLERGRKATTLAFYLGLTPASAGKHHVRRGGHHARAAARGSSSAGSLLAPEGRHCFRG